MGKLRADGQESYRRPARRVEVAPLFAEATKGQGNTPKASGMPVTVNAVAVQWSNVSLPGEICTGKPGQKSADAIVIEETSRSASMHSKVAGGLTR